MVSAVIHCDSVEVQTDAGPDIVNITDQLSVIAEKSGISDGSLNASVIGSTGSLTAIEFEPGVVEDLKQLITKLAPEGMDYEHERTCNDGNGHSHIQAALLGPSVVVPVRGGRLVLGTWQQVVVINHDKRSRNRRVEVTVIGVPVAGKE